jgi:uncharacterized protein with GYD domain
MRRPAGSPAAPERAVAMAFYLIQVAYRDTALKSLVTHPQTREDVIKKSCASLRGKLHSFYFSFGEYDVVAIAEFPDNASAAAFALATSAKGAVAKFHTTVLMTGAEAVDAMKKAQKVDYAPPK